MPDLENEIRRRYLDKLDRPDWEENDPSLDFGVQAIPFFTAAFEKDVIPQRRALLTRVIWQFRDVSALPTLALALHDDHPEVWKDALDGFVTLACEQSLTKLREERNAVAVNPTAAEKLSWIDEAIAQIIDEIERKKLVDHGPG